VVDHSSERETEPAVLGDLLSGGDGSPLTNADIVDDVRKQKPKRKPKLWSGFSGRNTYLIVAAGIGFAVAILLVVFIAPVREVSSVQVVTVPVQVPVTVPVIMSQTPQGLPGPVTPPPASLLEESTSTDPLIGRWMLVDGAYNMPPRTPGFVLSKDTNGNWYNVADANGYLALVPPEWLSPLAVTVPDSVRPPIGPFDYAINKMEKLVVVLDQHGDIGAGAPVYVMGWRAEDGTWIYQVSKDLVKPEYVPAGFLAWAPGVVPPTREPLPLPGL
jgi:hypothetical protein